MAIVPLRLNTLAAAALLVALLLSWSYGATSTQAGDSATAGPGSDAVAAAASHTCALKAGGVTCWGYNSSGQLGNGTTTASTAPVGVTGLASGVSAISASESHTCALQDGGVKCWGYNGNGELGNGTTSNSQVPVTVTGLSSGVSAISAGDFLACALKDGAVKCWGDNAAGQLGNGTTTNSSVPVAVTGLSSGVSAISAGGAHACALKDGAVSCWGFNPDGRLGNGTTTPSSVPVAVTGLTSGVSAISAGGDHTCALKDGAAKCWGANADGQLGNGTTTDSSVPVAVTSLASGVSAITDGGANDTCALKDGGAWCWGYNGAGELGDGTTTDRHVPVTVTGLSGGVSAISAGGIHTCALKDGSALCWGANFAGKLGDGSTTERHVPVTVAAPLTISVTAITAGWSHACGVRRGAAWCWGGNGYGELGNGTTTYSASPVAVNGMGSGIIAISAGFQHTCALKDGGVWCWGYNGNGQLGDSTTTNSSVPVAVSGLSSGVSAISAGYADTCAIQNGSIWCWGYNLTGQLGDGTTTGSSVPVAVSGLGSGATAVSAGNIHTCAVKDGAAQCWGYNAEGQLGNGTTTTGGCYCLSTPVAVSGLGSGVTAISVSEDQHACALKDGGAWCWGHNGAGQLGDGGMYAASSVPVAVSGFGSGVSAISTGGFQTCARKDGGVSCWGFNAYGQLGDGTTTGTGSPVAVSGMGTGVSAISGGLFHTCALNDGAAWCWGDNSSGEIGDGTVTERHTPVLVNFDIDGDGLDSSIDGSPASYSDAFSDVPIGGTTYGAILDRNGCQVTVVDAPNPADGVLIGAACTGGLPATISMLCPLGLGTLSVPNGASIVASCDSFRSGTVNKTEDFAFGPAGHESQFVMHGVAGATSVISDQGNDQSGNPQFEALNAPTSRSSILVVFGGHTASLPPCTSILVAALPSSFNLKNVTDPMLCGTGSTSTTVDYRPVARDQTVALPATVGGISEPLDISSLPSNSSGPTTQQESGFIALASSLVGVVVVAGWRLRRRWSES